MTTTEDNPSLLVGALSQLLHSPEVISIEILPGGLQDWIDIDLPSETPKPSSRFPFVFVQGNLGIPQKVLRALYLVVVSLPWRSSGAENAVIASTVIILMSPAHQTALNTRKFLIKDGHLDPEKELSLIGMISRGSPECAKQSVIWDHRRWCLTQLFGVIGPVETTQPLQFWASSEEMQLFPKIGPAAVRRELDLVQHTCETYPRNYHSWTYWHFIIDVCYASICSSDNNASRRDFLRIIVTECTHLRQWVERHVSDFSAMHHLCQSHALLDHFKSQGLLSTIVEGVSVSPMPVDHALSLMTVYQSHESLWMYLRIAISTSTSANRAAILEELKLQIPPSRFRDQLSKWLSTSVESNPSTEIHSETMKNEAEDRNSRM